MLVNLPQTDLLSIKPDIDNLDIWQQFDINQIPAFKIGCYAFYTTDGIIVYIGSARAMSAHSSMSGLKYRIRAYRGIKSYPSTSTVDKIRKVNHETPLLMRLWFCDSIGDTLKYEADAILKHKPALNIVGVCRRSRQEMLKKHSERSLKTSSKYNFYDPDKLKVCSKCHIEKRCTEFSRHKRTKWGVRSQCKLCTKSGKGYQNGVA